MTDHTYDDHDYPIIGRTREAEYAKHGTDYQLQITVIGFLPCLNSWHYDPPYIDDDPIHPDMDEREMPSHFRGQDVTKCTVECHRTPADRPHDVTTPEIRHASLNRTVTKALRQIEWSSSCMIRNSTPVRIYSHRDDVEPDPGRHDYDMLWDLSHGDNPISIDDNLDMLAEHAWRLFDDQVQNRI